MNIFNFLEYCTMDLEAFWIKLLKKHWLSETIINHSIWVSHIAYELATKINSKAAEEIVDSKKLYLAWLLHDIWKSREWMHEFNSVDILKEEGLEELSEIIMHWFVYEHFKLKWREDKGLLPKTLEQKILCLADMYCDQNQKKVSIGERFDDIFERCSNDKDFLKVVELAKPRILKLEEEINSLIN